jgi:Fur family ferric uptake transcriptional regulator
MTSAKEHFAAYLKAHRIKHSAPRELVVGIFLDCERHVTATELAKLVQEKHPRVGITTVYRTLKLICDSGLAREVDFGEGIVRYEHDYGHHHHDHLICVKCGSFIEIHSEAIESAQELIAKQHNFSLTSHRLVLYGICSHCH